MERNLPAMFKPIEVAKILNVSRSQIYVLLRDGAIRSSRVGKTRRISENELVRYIRSIEGGGDEAI